MSLPILFSIPNGNGEYQLFGPLQNQNPIVDVNVYEISKSEVENICKKNILVQLSNIIEKYLNDNREDGYNLTKYTLYIIDEIECEVFIYIDHPEAQSNYYYKIISKNIEYEVGESLERDLLICLAS